MIVSVSRRTDVPAFYSNWLMHRLKDGFVDVVNPFDPRKVRRVDLRPEAVDAFIFWTRNPGPLFRYFKSIDSMGYKYYFLYTITGYPKVLEENLPPFRKAVETFKKLSEAVGPEKVIWRYDPIVFSPFTDREFHEKNFKKIAADLSGHTKRVIISFIDLYKKVRIRLKKLSSDKGITWLELSPDLCLEVASDLKQIAEAYNLEVKSCAEDNDLSSAGLKPGKCIDSDLLNRLFNLNIRYKKDPSQRKLCLCAQSVDIGAYNTCGYRCIYCYANSSFERSAANLRNIRPDSVSLSYNTP